MTKSALRVYSNNVVIGCTHCNAQAPISKLKAGRLPAPKSKIPFGHRCANCGVMLIEFDGKSYELLHRAKIVKMTVEGLSDLDLAKLMFRQVGVQSQGTDEPNELLKHGLGFLQFPKDFNVESFTADELLKEAQRREGSPVIAMALA